jgi:hypothetical protein
VKIAVKIEGRRKTYLFNVKFMENDVYEFAIFALKLLAFDKPCANCVLQDGTVFDVNTEYDDVEMIIRLKGNVRAVFTFPLYPFVNQVNNLINIMIGAEHSIIHASDTCFEAIHGLQRSINAKEPLDNVFNELSDYLLSD